MNTPRFLRRALIPVVGLSLLLAAGCASVASPEGWSPPTLDEDGELLFVSLDGGEITAFTSENDTFTELWTFPADDEFACGDEDPESHDIEGIYGEPAIAEDLVYIGAYDSHVYALSKEEGDCVWSFDTGDPIVGGLVLGGAGLYVPSTDGFLYLVDPESGEEINRFDAGQIWATPLLTENGEIYVTAMEGRLWKLDADDFTPLWDSAFEVSAGLLTTPVLAGDRVIAGGIGNKLYAVNAETGEELWSTNADNWFWGTPAVDDSRVYAPNMDGSVYAVDLESGDEAWSFETEAPVRAGVLLWDDALVAVNDQGDAHGIDTETGDSTWGPTELDETVHADPRLVGENVLVVSRSGNVFSLDENGRATEVID
jgi:outer membrane protein assembly factor BamB